MFKTLLAFKAGNDDTVTTFTRGLRQACAHFDDHLIYEDCTVDELYAIETETLQPSERMFKVFDAADPLEHEFVRWGFGRPKAFNELPFHIGRDYLAFSVEKRERRLETAIIQRATQLKVDDLAAKEHREVHRRELAGIKTEVVMDLLPKAFIKVKSILVVLTDDYLLVGTGSIKEADDVVNLLRRAFGDIGLLPFTVIPLGFRDITETDWLRRLLVDKQDLTGRFKPRNSVALKGVGTARFKDVELDDDELTTHLADKNVISLEVLHHVPDTVDFRVAGEPQLRDNVLFELTDQLALKRIRFSDILFADSGDGVEPDDLVSLFDSNAAIEVPTLTGLLRDLEDSAARYKTNDEDEL